MFERYAKEVWKISDQLQLELAIFLKIIDRFNTYLNLGTGVGTDVGEK